MSLSPDFLPSALRVSVRTGLLVFSLSMFAAKVYQSHKQLEAMELGTEVRLAGNLELDPPAITVCRPYPFRQNETVMGRFGLHNGQEETMEGYSLVESRNTTMRRALEAARWAHADVVYQAEAFDVVAFVNYGYHGDNEVEFVYGDEEDEARHYSWHPVYNPAYGGCVQLVVLREAFGHFRSALALIRMVFLKEKHEAGITNWLVFLHTPHNFGPSEEVLPVQTGYQVEYMINPVILQKENSESRPCLKGASEDSADYVNYPDRENCLLRCLERLYLEKHECQHPKIKRTAEISGNVADCDYEYYRNYFPNESEYKGLTDLQDLEVLMAKEDFLQANCDCPESCTSHVVTTSVNHKETYGENGHAAIVLRFPLSVQVFREFFIYTKRAFLSDLGAFIGLFLGASVYGLHDAVSGLILWIIARFFKPGRGIVTAAGNQDRLVSGKKTLSAYNKKRTRSSRAHSKVSITAASGRLKTSVSTS